MTAQRGTLAIVAACLFAGTVTINGERTHRLPAPPALPISPTLPTGAPVAHTFSHQPLSFEANRGQADPRVQFIARGAGYSIGLTPTAADLVLQPSSDTEAATMVRMTLAGARGTSRGIGVDELPGTINYFLGNDSTKWVTNVPTYARVEYADVYPGVDLVYYGHQRELEYDFIVAPGADPTRIALAFDGADGVELGGDRDLRLHVRGGGGDLRLHTPVVYQEMDGRRVSVESTFRIVDRLQSRVGIDVAAYDETRPLVIDPILSYSTYLGGDFEDEGYAIAVDSAGNAYVTGKTRPNLALVFPVTPGAFQTTVSECCVAFVTKFSPTGGIVYSTFLGGASGLYGATAGFGIALDSDGNAYITGFTQSANFPTVNPIQAVCGGSGHTCPFRTDAFVTKLNPTGSALVYSTFIGGYENEYAQGIAVDPAGNAYITGGTTSADFPASHALPSLVGGQNVFVVKVNPAGSAFVYATYLGGALTGLAIAADSNGNAYVTGQASGIFPTTSGAVQESWGGAADAFVTKIDATGSALVYSTFLGGSGDDTGYGIAVDGDGHAYVTGTTCSINFPTANPLQANHGGGNCDAFVSKLNTAGSALVYSTYLGGASPDGANGIAVDGAGNAYVTGTTFVAFPTVDPIQAVGAGSIDAFVAKLNAAGSALVYSTNLGGSNNDYGYGIAVDGAGSAYIVGQTASQDFPTTVNAIQPHSGTFYPFPAAFVAKIESPGADVAITKTGSADSVVVGQSLTYTIAVVNNGPTGATGVTVTDALPSGVTFVSATPSAGTCAGTSTVTCSIGALANGASASIAIKVTATSVGPLDNSASVASNESDPNHANNSAAVTTTVTKGDVTVTLASSANPSTFIQPVTFTATVSGVPPAPGMPTGMVTFEEGATTLGTAAVDGSGHATIATSSLAAGLHSIVAAYSGDGVFNPNDSAPLAQTVTALVDLSITKAAAPNPVTAGQPLTYTMTVGNAGPSPATGVTLSDTLPAGVAFVSSTASQGSCSGTATVTCAIGSLASGASATVTIVVTPAAAGTLTNAANVAANEPDATMANNSASVQTTVTAVVQTATIADLLSKVNGLGLNGGLKNSLSVKLQAAQQSLSKGNRGAAINQLNAFINQVRALKQSGQLNASTADPLIAEAQAIIAGI